MSHEKKYEEVRENFVDIPITSRRSGLEEDYLEFLRLRSEIEDHFKEIRTKKDRIQEILTKEPSLKDLDSKLRKIPREAEEERVEKAKKRKNIQEQEDDQESKRKKKIKNAISRKKQQHRDYIQSGYTMTEQEIAKEGGEVGKQYVYFKELGDGKSSTHIIKGIEGLKLSSTLGEEAMEH
jgi:deoxyhypusine synthase